MIIRLTVEAFAEAREPTLKTVTSIALNKTVHPRSGKLDEAATYYDLFEKSTLHPKTRPSDV